MLADYKTSENPIDVPVSSIQHLRRRTLYCGNSVSGIFIGICMCFGIDYSGWKILLVSLHSPYQVY